METVNNNLVGIGLYSVSEASALTGISSQKIRRWLFNSNQQHDNLWETQLTPYGLDGLGFADLLEVRFVDAFRKIGISLQTIRLAAKNAREFYNSDYPFTVNEFRTDGRTIFASTQEEANDPCLIDLVKRQYAFEKVISPSLYKGIEYDNEGNVRHWYPLGKSKKVVIDPQRSFGKPIVTEGSVPTEALSQSYNVEKDFGFVAKLYDVSTASVKAAVDFEERIVSGELLH